MHTSISESELRRAWQRLRMVGDFDIAMRHTAVRRVVESAARAMRARSTDRKRPTTHRRRTTAKDHDA
ncbi:hypothetical protein [Mycetohabitans endofungorum]|uniref:hypothetical protein n=1 Tax=Mycetohabitans endofungorum TaxID=417203 RepID=UPI003BB1A24F